VDWLAPFQSGQRLNRFSSFLFGEPQVVKALEIQPELRTGAEEMSEAQSGIAGDGARSVQDLRDAIGRHVHFARQFRRAQVKRFQFFSQVFAGWIAAIAITILLVIIDNLHVGRPR
jgi:hypothetical protein